MIRDEEIGEMYAAQWAFDWFDNHLEIGSTRFPQGVDNFVMILLRKTLEMCQKCR
jgi:hypothetical protein